MPTNPLRFRLSEAARLFKAAKAAGLPVKQLTIDGNGRPVIVVEQNGGEPPPSPPPENPWEDDTNAA